MTPQQLRERLLQAKARTNVSSQTPSSDVRSAEGTSNSPAREAVAAVHSAAKEVQDCVPKSEVAVVGAAAPLAVTTDVQPSTLVVLERSAAASESGIAESNSEVVGAGDEVGGHRVPATNLDTTNPIHAGFLQRLADLEESLLNRDPLMKTHLGAIHKTMIQYEEIPVLLTVEEISKIMAAQQQHTNVVLKQVVGKASKAAANKKATGVTLADI